MEHFLVGLLISAGGALGTLLAIFLKKMISKINNESLQQAAYIAVRFVEKKFAHIASSEKFNIAYEKIAAKLPGVEDSNIEEAIEAALKGLDIELGKKAGSAAKSSKRVSGPKIT